MSRDPIKADVALMVPGWTGSGSGHWMSAWEADDPTIVRVQQSDWDRPDPELWLRVLEQAVARRRERVALIAHSCGVSTVQRWAHADERRVACAILVAPPDPDQPGAPDEVSRFGRMRPDPLPFPALVIASRTDPNCTFDRAARFAASWGAEFVDARDAGHLNTASGHGPWPQGRDLVDRFIRRHAADIEQPSAPSGSGDPS